MTLSQLKAKMGIIQTEFMKRKLPIIVLFNGWSAAGKGTIISDLISRMDPRGYNVFSIEPESPLPERYSPLQCMFDTLPCYGKMSILDGSWYSQIVAERIKGNIGKEELSKLYKSTVDFERALSNDGYLIIKFMLDISKEEQRERFEDLKSKKSTRWRVKDFDEFQNEHYDEFKECYDNLMEDTTSAHSPWIKVDASDTSVGALRVFSEIISAIEKRFEQVTKYETPCIIPSYPTQGLDGCDLKAYLPKQEYRKMVRDLQKKIKKLHTILYMKKIPVVIGYEGWDAAGKGGNIRRLSSALDPRGFDVIPVSAPNEAEREHQYMWRFWNNLPKTGHVSIFDRTWYGRVMVERIEGFCSQWEYNRAYEEIKEFETYLADNGHVVLKFFINIDSDEQLRRFEARRDDPTKSWKLTDEDWRNRKKWDLYEQAISEMITKTNTEKAPWYIIPSNDKSFARVKVLTIVANAFEKAIKDKEEK